MGLICEATNDKYWLLKSWLLDLRSPNMSLNQKYSMP